MVMFKYFVGNELEIECIMMSFDVDECSLCEVYLCFFEDVVKKVGIWGIMFSYNWLNGIFILEYFWLLIDVLWDEWGYDGIVMFDWFGLYIIVEMVNVGLDLEMLGFICDCGDKLIEVVENGDVFCDMICICVLNILWLM